MRSSESTGPDALPGLNQTFVNAPFPPRNLPRLRESALKLLKLLSRVKLVRGRAFLRSEPFGGLDRPLKSSNGLGRVAALEAKKPSGPGEFRQGSNERKQEPVVIGGKAEGAYSLV
jgi:hypothetical protein